MSETIGVLPINLKYCVAFVTVVPSFPDGVTVLFSIVKAVACLGFITSAFTSFVFACSFVAASFLLLPSAVTVTFPVLGSLLEITTNLLVSPLIGLGLYSAI